ncbi:hypothetical protein LUZ60_004760 [Juncus effusus]|nr:hypothetical protein LUZ60_004760 [Juncus effusus]
MLLLAKKLGGCFVTFSRYMMGCDPLLSVSSNCPVPCLSTNFLSRFKSLMAYVPPHKRQSNPNPTPTIFSKNKTQNPNNPSRAKSHHKTPNPSRNIVFSPHSISRWYHTSSETDHLTQVPYSCEEFERNNGEKPLTLTVSDEMESPTKEEERRVLNGVVEKVVRDLEETSRHAREERENAEEREGEKLVKLSVVARIGKVLFKERYKSDCIRSIRSALTSEEELNKKNKKNFYTDLTDEYMRYTEELLIQKCGFQIENEKDNYLVLVIDKDQPDSTISSKCIVLPDGNLEHFKAEQSLLRYMVTDISCLHKDFDLRIMLNTKRVLKNLDADVAEGVNTLLKAAVINPEVKGGLTWPLGKDSFSKRFFVTGFWHLKYKILRREKIRVCLRNVYRFDQNTSKGEASNEVTFKLKGVSELLTEGDIVKNTVVDMIQEAVELIWTNFLSNNGF